jgi:hypothetical protein
MADQPPSTDDLSRLPTDEDLGRLQWTTLDYYLKESNPVNGLIRDKTDPRTARRGGGSRRTTSGSTRGRSR